jgi:hypothetical protein
MYMAIAFIVAINKSDKGREKLLEKQEKCHSPHPPSVKQLDESMLFDSCKPPIDRFLPINCIEYAIILYTYRKYYARSKVMRLSQGKIIYLLINRSAVVTTTCAFITKRLAVVTTTYALVTTAGAFITKRLAVVSSSTKLNIKIGL